MELTEKQGLFAEIMKMDTKIIDFLKDVRPSRLNPCTCKANSRLHQIGRNHDDRLVHRTFVDDKILFNI